MRLWLVFAVVLVVAWVGISLAQQPVIPTAADGTPLAAPSDNTGGDVLYNDPTAQSSATITQILPNSTTNISTFGAVRRVRVQHDILVIEWASTATTMFPRQYVGSVSINHRAPDQH